MLSIRLRLMLAAVLLHAGVAWYYGYRWIFT